jgi:hypothetical protein
MKPEQLAHLHNLAYGGLGRARTPDDVAEELVKNGYAKHAAGGLMATDIAHRVLLQHGIKPPRWQ